MSIAVFSFPGLALMLIIAALRESRAAPRTIVQAHGQIYFTDLEDELEVPSEMLHRWVRKLVRKNIFSGYINWGEGLLYSVAAENLGDDSLCPKCGGKLGVEGEIIECPYCGSKVLWG